MDLFKPDFDVFCTTDGKAQDRLPSDISQMAIQEGTVLNAEMVNSWTFEIYNLIESLGITPDSTQNNQLAIGFKKRTVYNQVGKVNSWFCPKDQIPKTEAVLDGTTLMAKDYEDGLAELKKRCPSWVSGDNISLPSLNGYFPRFDSSRTLGGTQQDAMQKVEVNVYPTVSNPKMPELSIPGELLGVGYNGEPEGYRRLGSVLNPTETMGALTLDLIQEDSTTTEISTDFKLSLNTNLTQDGSVANENRPKNFAVLMSVVVGIPKKVEVQNGQV